MDDHITQWFYMSIIDYILLCCAVLLSCSIFIGLQNRAAFPRGTTNKTVTYVITGVHRYSYEPLRH